MKKIKGYIYLFESYHKDHGEVYKIGLTKNEITERKRNLETGNPNNLTLIHTYPCSISPKYLEARLHKRFNFDRIKGEWFILSNEDVKDFNNNCTILENALIAAGFK